MEQNNQNLKYKCCSKLSRLGNTFFWSMISYFLFVFLLYFGCVLLISVLPFFPQVHNSFFLFLQSLPNSINVIFSLFFVFHLWIGVFLSLLVVISDFADDLFHNKSVKEHILRLSSPFAKSVIGVAGLFLLLLAAGFIIGFFNPEIFESFFNLSGLPENASWDIVFSIFFNNAKIIFMILMFSFIFWILPLLVTVANGFTIGFVAEYTIKSEGLLFLLVGLLPHSIIEIPVILLGLGVGFRLGCQAFKLIFKNGNKERKEKKEKLNIFKREFIDAFWFYFLICVPMLFIAAIIEVFITTPLLEFF